MTREDVLKKITALVGEALEAIVAEMGDELERAGLEPRIGCHISLFEQPTSPAKPAPVACSADRDDADFLRKLRIVPDLEAQ